MLINCVVYQDGRRLAEVQPEDIHRYLAMPGCFVWVALLDRDPATLELMRREFSLHPLAVARRLRDAFVSPEYKDPAVYRLLVSSLFSSPASIIPGGIAGVLAPTLCWNATGSRVFLELALLTAAIVILRVITVVRYRRADQRRQTLADTKRWDREFFVGATAFVFASIAVDILYTVLDPRIRYGSRR